MRNTEEQCKLSRTDTLVDFSFDSDENSSGVDRDQRAKLTLSRPAHISKYGFIPAQSITIDDYWDVMDLFDYLKSVIEHKEG